MCQVLNVSESGYHAWYDRPVSQREMQNMHLQQRIYELFYEHKGRVGSPSLTADLRDEALFASISRQRVARQKNFLFYFFSYFGLTVQL